ncbi:non-specific lipid transfer protein GPI-anchored 16-like [Magnolia sinica]|uniref:non-specific lipid transfer protein GPI-anchored 16-like n=1 Tax=Magnolia sinica TaxID=86752 RepID=UPI00265B4BDE|nr:non-specific lipid transfer protein GPI-anchored 16-like [Magnolia sinica]
MEVIKGLLVVMILAIPMWSVSGQINSACTASMISSFTPCLNFITGSTGNGNGSPTTGCCSSLGSLVGSGSDCACLILTGNVPFQLPINRTLAISLPRACNMAPVPLACKASASPLPAPGPFQFGPPLPLPPRSSPDSSSPSPSPFPDASDLPPVAPPTSSVTPGVPGLRPVLTPNSASKLYNMNSPSLLVFVLGIVVLKYF